MERSIWEVVKIKNSWRAEQYIQQSILFRFEKGCFCGCEVFYDILSFDYAGIAGGVFCLECVDCGYVFPIWERSGPFEIDENGNFEPIACN